MVGGDRHFVEGDIWLSKRSFTFVVWELFRRANEVTTEVLV